MKKQIAHEKLPLNLGRQYEQGVTEIAFDISELIEEFGQGRCELFVKRPGENESYPAKITTEGNFVKWLIKKPDVAIDGYGKAQLSFYKDDICKKECIYSTKISKSLCEVADIDAPQQEWANDVIKVALDAKQSAEESKSSAVKSESYAHGSTNSREGEETDNAKYYSDKAQEAIDKQPKIIDEHWYVWDAKKSEYIKDIKANGLKPYADGPEPPADTELLWVDPNDDYKDSLPPLTFSGAVNAEYDGTKPLNVRITSGSDWNENDPDSPSYIKNRPGGYEIHGEYCETINKQEYPFEVYDEDEGLIACEVDLSGKFNQFHNDIYIGDAVYKNVEFTYVADFHNPIYYYGNANLFPNLLPYLPSPPKNEMDFCCLVGFGKNGPGDINEAWHGLCIVRHAPVSNYYFGIDHNENRIVKISSDYIDGIPTKLPNPNAIKFIGGASGVYDGSEPLEVEISSVGRFTSDIDYGEHGFGKTGAEIYNSYEPHLADDGITEKANIAVGAYSHAEGDGTIAKGDNAHAEGWRAQALERTTHAEGGRTVASGRTSHAEGSYTTASGYRSHAEGYYTEASGNDSHAEGYKTKAKGDRSHAEGDYSEATGKGAHAEGLSNKSSGEGSHAEGALAYATADCSHAEGWITEANGNQSHVEGCGTTASGEDQHVQGRYNIEDTVNKYAHIVGNGSCHNMETVYSNAHTLDWQGNSWYQGDVLIGGKDMDDPATISLKKLEQRITELESIVKGGV